MFRQSLEKCLDKMEDTVNCRIMWIQTYLDHVMQRATNVDFTYFKQINIFTDNLKLLLDKLLP